MNDYCDNNPSAFFHKRKMGGGKQASNKTYPIPAIRLEEQNIFVRKNKSFFY